jgi:hypothetical protein
MDQSKSSKITSLKETLLSNARLKMVTEKSKKKMDKRNKGRQVISRDMGDKVKLRPIETMVEIEEERPGFDDMKREVRETGNIGTAKQIYYDDWKPPVEKP